MKIITSFRRHNWEYHQLGQLGILSDDSFNGRICMLDTAIFLYRFQWNLSKPSSLFQSPKTQINIKHKRKKCIYSVVALKFDFWVVCQNIIISWFQVTYQVESLFTLSQLMSDIRMLVPTKFICKSLNLMLCFHLYIFQVLSVLTVNNGMYVPIQIIGYVKY